MMRRLSARARIVMGQIALLVSVLMLAVALGFMPSPRDAIVDGRAQLCESIAISSSVLATRGDTAGMQAALAAIASRDKEIISVGVREKDKLVAVVGDHESGWKNAKTSAPGTCVVVPIFSNEQPWGTVEVIFRPL
jgi:hypothetical protein